MNTRRTLIALVPATALALLFANCHDFDGTVRNCVILSEIGKWYTLEHGDGSFEYWPTFGRSNSGCPVPIVQVGEKVVTSGYVIRKVEGIETPTEQAVLQVWNSLGYGQAAGIFGFRRLTIYEVEADLFLEYPAATGRKVITDEDKLRVSIRDYCCALPQLVGEIDLSIDYMYDGGLRVTLSGNDVPARSTGTTWTALSESGGRPHTFRWYRDGSAVGTGGTYTANTGTSPFDLRVDATDTYGRTASTWMAIEPGGVRTSITGPLTVYASAGGGTWQASGRGGTLPYTFRWFLDDEKLGEGATWSGYPGPGSHVVRVVTTDATGVSNAAVARVTGIGDDTCEPQPPAVTC